MLSGISCNATISGLYSLIILETWLIVSIPDLGKFSIFHVIKDRVVHGVSLISISIEPPLESEKTNSDKLRLKKGLIHELNYFKELSKKYKKIKNIKDLKSLSKKEKIKETIKALKQGYELIYGGWLESDKWSGELDFLEINKDI